MELTELRLVFGNGNACAIKDNETGTGGTLINGADKPFLQVVPMSVLILQECSIPIICLVGSDREVIVLIMAGF